MAKVYLRSGQQFSLDVIARAGEQGSVNDLQVEWAGSLLDNSGLAARGRNVGEVVVDERFTYAVYLEADSGRLWFDDERGY